MTNLVDPIACSDCGVQNEEHHSTSTIERNPFPSSDSMPRVLSVLVKDSFTIHEKIGMKHKRLGHKKPIYESVAGDDLYRATGKWNELTREIDRQNDTYKEIIVDPQSGEVIRHIEEPLTEHTKRGSAKSKAKQKE